MDITTDKYESYPQYILFQQKFMYGFSMKRRSLASKSSWGNHIMTLKYSLEQNYISCEIGMKTTVGTSLIKR